MKLKKHLSSLGSSFLCAVSRKSNTTLKKETAGILSNYQIFLTIRNDDAMIFYISNAIITTKLQFNHQKKTIIRSIGVV